jgi:hypothetical protein
MFDLADLGSIAPVLSLRAAGSGADEEPQRRSRLLAFIRAWTMDSEDLEHVRARLAELDTELVIVSDDGAWSFIRDHEPVFCDRLAADVATAAAAYGVTVDAVFVIDHRGVLRFVHRPNRPLSATLTEALDAAADALGFREHQTQLERIRFTPREWALKSLVIGCSVTFGEPVDRRRLARGTGPVGKYESREVITPRAETDAESSQLVEVSEWPTVPSLRRLA